MKKSSENGKTITKNKGDDMFIPIILGTARKGRESEKAAEFMWQEVKESGAETEILDVRDFRIDATDNTQEIEEAKKLERSIKRADAIVIVSPEYNHGYPGELKMMLDMLYEQYFHKPVGICGVSAGGLGGARMVEQLKQVCLEFHMLPIRNSVYFSKVQDLFDEDGKITDSSYHKMADKFIKELKLYAEAQIRQDR